MQWIQESLVAFRRACATAVELPGAHRSASFAEPTDFADPKVNMHVLCATHHRAQDEGLHAIRYPVWIVQHYLKDEFNLS